MTYSSCIIVFDRLTSFCWHFKRFCFSHREAKKEIWEYSGSKFELIQNIIIKLKLRNIKIMLN